MIKTFQRKPTQIQAVQWTGQNRSEISEFGAQVRSTRTSALSLWVEANKAWLDLEQGEWIAKDQLGFYPIKDVMIQENYEEVTSLPGTGSASGPTGLRIETPFDIDMEAKRNA